MNAIYVAILFAISLTAFADDTVRLTHGDRSGDGRVEVLFQGQWGLVCADNFDLADAHVICKQLDISEYATVNTNRITNAELPFVLGNIRCSGVEDSLLSCKYDQYPSCPSQLVADVTCGQEPIGATGSLGSTAGIIAAIVICLVAVIGVSILLVGCLWRNNLFGLNCCNNGNSAV